MKVLLCSIAAALLGFIGFWCLEFRQRLEEYADPGEDVKAGGTD